MWVNITPDDYWHHWMPNGLYWRSWQLPSAKNTLLNSYWLRHTAPKAPDKQNFVVIEYRYWGDWVCCNPVTQYWFPYPALLSSLWWNNLERKKRSRYERDYTPSANKLSFIYVFFLRDNLSRLCFFFKVPLSALQKQNNWLYISCPKIVIPVVYVISQIRLAPRLTSIQPHRWSIK